MPSSSSIIKKLVSKRSKPESWKPKNYQIEGVTWLLGHAAGGLFFDPGLGKTSVTLAAIKILLGEGVLRRVIVFAPLRVCRLVWAKEAKKWKDFNGLRMEFLHGPDKDKALRRDADIYLINYEGIPWLMSGNRVKVLKADTAVFDECSKLKNSQGKRFKVLKAQLPKFRRRWILTGTPTANHLMDLFGQMYILDGGRSLGGYITHFRDRFFTSSGYGGYTYKLRPDAEEDIYTAIAPYILRKSAEENLEMPKLVLRNILVDLPPKARKVYNAIENEYFSLLDGVKGVEAETAASASIKCRQVASGALYYNWDGDDYIPPGKLKRWTEVHDEKIQATIDFVEELGGKPLIIAYNFGHELARLQKVFGKDTPYIGGGVSVAKSEKIEEAWNAGEIPILLAHPKAMAHGLNMQGSGNHMLWFSPTWNFEEYDQLIRRIYRQGQKNKTVFVHHLVVEDTIEEVVIGTLRRKNRTQQSLFEALQKYAKESR